MMTEKPQSLHNYIFHITYSKGLHHMLLYLTCDAGNLVWKCYKRYISNFRESLSLRNESEIASKVFLSKENYKFTARK